MALIHIQSYIWRLRAIGKHKKCSFLSVHICRPILANKPISDKAVDANGELQFGDHIRLYLWRKKPTYLYALFVMVHLQ